VDSIEADHYADHAELAREAAQRVGKRSGVLGRSAVFVNVAFRSAKARAFAGRKD